MKYSVKSEILENEDMAKVAWDAIAPIWSDLPFQRFKTLATFMEDLTEGQRGLIALDWCQKEIRNGGLPQLFMNSTGNLVPWAIQGFRLIGAMKYASILSETASMLGHEYPQSASARQKAYKNLSQLQKTRLADLENEFFSLLSSTKDDLEQFRGSYVKNHPEQFIQMP